jgi:hypothetical protein
VAKTLMNATAEKDIIVVGDFNVEPYGEYENNWESLKALFNWLNVTPSTVGRQTHCYDNILVNLSTNANLEVVGAHRGKATVVDLLSLWGITADDPKELLVLRREVSDHLPLYCKLKTGINRDGAFVPFLGRFVERTSAATAKARKRTCKTAHHLSQAKP